MVDHSDEENLANSTNAQSESTLDNIISTEGTDLITPKQETKNMEVHHHPDIHHKPKNGKSIL